eukprot:189385_1
MSLSTGSVQRMVSGDVGHSPQLQVLDVKKIVTGQSGERFRLVLSDGDYYIQGMLSSQCTSLVNSKRLQKFTVIQLKEWVCNNIKGKKICVVIQCDVIRQMQAGVGKPRNALNPNQPPHNPQISPNRAQNRPAAPQNQQAFHQRNTYNNQNQSNFNSNPNNNYRGGGGGGGYGNNNNNYANNYGSNVQNVQPVSSLNPYQNSWRIKVRCTRKDTMKHYHNQKGDGKLFGVDLLDKQGTEIRAVMFNEAAEKFFNVFESNRVFLISKGQVRLARKGFSSIKNDYSITLNADAEVVPVADDDAGIEQQKYKFVKIAGIQQIDPKSFVDVIGVVVDVGPVSTIMSNRTQKEMKRRNLKIADETAKIDVTLWNDDAENFNEDRVTNNPNTIIALKGCKVSNFGGRSLSASGVVDFHPDRKETRDLLQWVQSLNGSIQDQQIQELTTGMQGISGDSKRMTFQEVKDLRLGEGLMGNMNGKKADYFTCVATITTISHSQDKKPWYEANPDPNSDSKNAKVTAMGEGKWRCEKNGKVYNSYVPRYVLRFCATDCTGNVWLTAFNEAAEKILKKTAVEAEKLYNNDPEQYEDMIKQAQFQKYVFRCKATSDVWEDSQRVRYDCVGVQIANPQQEAEKVLDKIQKLQSLKNNSNNNY